MSYNIYRSFSVKNGVIRRTDAESNLFDSNGGYIFRACEVPLYPESPIERYAFNYPAHSSGNQHYPEQVKGEPVLDKDGNEQPNEWYGLTDEEIYAKWMLMSAYCGDKHYAERPKAILQLCFDFAAKKQAAHDAAWKAENGIDPALELDYHFLCAAAKDSAYTPHRYHHFDIKSAEELAELVEYLRTNKDRYKRYKVCISFNGYTVRKAKEDGYGISYSGDPRNTVKLSKPGIEKVLERLAANGYSGKVEYVK